jgi:hypothetical protein
LFDPYTKEGISWGGEAARDLYFKETLPRAQTLTTIGAYYKTALPRLNEVTCAVGKFYKSSSVGRAGSPMRLTSSVH